MNKRNSYIFPAVTAAFCLIIKWFSVDELRVEKYYANGFYPPLARSMRFLFGSIPFSLGDILYAIFACWLIGKGWKAFKFMREKQWCTTSQNKYFGFFRRIFLRLAWIYIIFNVFWGLNYNRQGITKQLGLQINEYETADLHTINELLLQKVRLTATGPDAVKTDSAFSRQFKNNVHHAYQAAQQQFSFLKYENPSLKPSLWGWFGNYAGFTGYYNPFSGEAHVNTSVPAFLQPYIACHEVAHQLGYAKEMEANFVGYLAGSVSPNAGMQYSTYLDLFMYANRNLFNLDSTAARFYAARLPVVAKKNITQWRNFARAHRGPLGPVVSWMYDKFLISNEQPQGSLSYDEVVAFLIAYHKKFGRI